MVLLVTITALFTALATAQQGVLSNGNSQLPQCGQSCAKLQQAAQACSATDTASQTAWICFCQSAYLTTLYTTGTGICDDTCTSQSDTSQISTWYKSNCGSDNGASEHAGDTGAAASTSAAAGASSTRAAGSAATSSGSSGSTTTTGNQGSSNSNSGTTSNKQTGDWWSNHYQWIVMVIVLAIFLPAIGFGAAWLKRRHDRKQDQISGGFNAGITSRSAGPMTHDNYSGPVSAASGRNSPARTRDAFMPYGYGYNHSESRVGSRTNVGDDRRSPLARGGTPAGDLEKGESPAKKKLKKVLVRERSAEDTDNEKR